MTLVVQKKRLPVQILVTMVDHRPGVQVDPRLRTPVDQALNQERLDLLATADLEPHRSLCLACSVKRFDCIPYWITHTGFNGIMSTFYILQYREIKGLGFSNGHQKLTLPGYKCWNEASDDTMMKLLITKTAIILDCEIFWVMIYWWPSLSHTCLHNLPVREDDNRVNPVLTVIHSN